MTSAAKAYIALGLTGHGYGSPAAYVRQRNQTESVLENLPNKGKVKGRRKNRRRKQHLPKLASNFISEVKQGFSAETVQTFATGIHVRTL
ncbi:hypothetical protein M404DRAFT_995752 [Pisolithus tinctorius Marx 270]|uniref:Uncharacterized protein n=1 Tax=Pisolithus tinctorius Marx 270 TaxID=870435 RepID=A0A0C3PAA9_PISTI|nr:hypothetical protein M404DRAFT_995752 [Pisolithus tinctorius Marx 270]